MGFQSGRHCRLGPPTLRTMDDATSILSQQLGRMRGMTLAYHRRFFGDIRLAVVSVLTLFALGFWEIPEMFLLIPVVALYSAVQTAFDASYLIFARHYAARLERSLNARTGHTLLVAAEMENAYLFPLVRRKVVTAHLGSGFSWFGFVTLFYTALGLALGGFGLALGWTTVLADADAGWRSAYIVTLLTMTASALIVGGWWFVGGAGERRLHAALAGFENDEHRQDGI